MKSVCTCNVNNVAVISYSNFKFIEDLNIQLKLTKL